MIAKLEKGYPRMKAEVLRRQYPPRKGMEAEVLSCQC